MIRRNFDQNRIGMICFILSEAVFFLLLILAYLYFHIQAGQNGPNAANSLDPLRTGIFSIFLIASSFTVWLANRSLGRGKQTGFRFWLLATILLGLIFLIGQGTEWNRLIGEKTTISSNLFGTTFFTLTGFHGLHVLIGLIMLSVLLGLAFSRSLRGASSPALEVISLYWHFVDLVWIIIFSTVYLGANAFIR
jgi:heme/copper-type cytochrome/quinol oxidase subunit 3